MSKGSRTRSRLIRLGRVVGVHGIQGAVKIGAAVAAPEIFLTQEEVDVGGTRYRVRSAAQQKRQVLLHLEDVENREQAELLIGQEVMGDSSRFPALPQGEYYWFQLEGLPVKHAVEGTHLGELAEIIPTPAHDVYVVVKEGRELLLPAVGEVIIDINLEEGWIKALPPAGLLETYAD